MMLLDTNVISELMRIRPDPNVVAWLNRLSFRSVFISAISIFEIRFGILRLPEGRRRDDLCEAFDGLVNDIFRDRVLAFDNEAATLAAAIAAERERRGVLKSVNDTWIAAVALTAGAKLATRNLRDFDDLPVDLVNPWSATT
jgi:predicted nucleic acid-binding protein